MSRKEKYDAAIQRSVQALLAADLSQRELCDAVGITMPTAAAHLEEIRRRGYPLHERQVRITLHGPLATRYRIIPHDDA